MIPKSIQFKILAFVAVLYGLYSSSTGSDEGKQLAKIEKNGVTVPGLIETARTQRSGRRSIDYMMTVSYQLQSGEARKSEFEVTSDFFASRTGAAGPGPGAITQPAVEVRYVPTHPDLAMVVGGSPNQSSRFWTGLAIAAAGLAGLIYLFVSNPFED